MLTISGPVVKESTISRQAQDIERIQQRSCGIGVQEHVGTCENTAAAGLSYPLVCSFARQIMHGASNLKINEQSRIH